MVGLLRSEPRPKAPQNSMALEPIMADVSRGFKVKFGVFPSKSLLTTETHGCFLGFLTNPENNAFNDKHTVKSFNFVV